VSIRDRESGHNQAEPARACGHASGAERGKPLCQLVRCSVATTRCQITQPIISATYRVCAVRATASQMALRSDRSSADPIPIPFSTGGLNTCPRSVDNTECSIHPDQAILPHRHGRARGDVALVRLIDRIHRRQPHRPNVLARRDLDRQRVHPANRPVQNDPPSACTPGTAARTTAARSAVDV
jgi:hypothetical protein